jgi:hypothetical protein
MILRRIAQHMKQQHWTGVFIELLIVILGVFIGLQVDNWNQARVERGAEITYLSALSQDVSYSITSLEKSRQELIEADRDRAALYAYSMAPTATLSDELLDKYLRDGVFNLNGTLNISQVTFQTLKSSGHLEVIKSHELVSALQDISSDVARIEHYQADELEVIHLFSDPVLIEHFDLRGTFQLQMDPDDPAVPWLPKDRLPMPRPKVLGSVRFRNILLYRSKLSEIRLEYVRKLLDLQRKVAKLIKARQRELGVRP